MFKNMNLYFKMSQNALNIIIFTYKMFSLIK